MAAHPFILLSQCGQKQTNYFRWNSYETNILSTFEGLLDSEALSDVTLFCEGKFIQVSYPDWEYQHFDCGNLIEVGQAGKQF